MALNILNRFSPQLFTLLPCQAIEAMIVSQFSISPSIHHSDEWLEYSRYESCNYGNDCKLLKKFFQIYLKIYPVNCPLACCKKYLRLFHCHLTKGKCNTGESGVENDSGLNWLQLNYFCVCLLRHMEVPRLGVWAIAAGLRQIHSNSNTRSQPHLWPTP